MVFPTTTFCVVLLLMARCVRVFADSLSYWDLNCPYEWGKYSCVHMGNMKEATVSLKFFYEHHQLMQQYLSRQDAFMKKKVLIVGDSLSRQLFISLGCLLKDQVESDVVRWATPDQPWPGDEGYGTLPYGPHSGFWNGRFKWKAGGELIVLYESEMALEYGRNDTMEVSIVKGLQRYLEREEFRDAEWNKPMSAGGHVDDETLGKQFQRMAVHMYASIEIIVLGPGVHNEPTAREYWEDLANLARAFRNLYQSVRHSKKLILHVSPPQHFNSPAGDGVYTEDVRFLPCVERIYVDKRAAVQKNYFKVGRNIDAILEIPELKDMGALHVGYMAATGTMDCTHYCMPGLADLHATKLVNLIAEISS